METETPSRRTPPRVAYLLFTHRNVPGIARLVNTIQLQDPQSEIWISHDRDGEAGVEDLAESPGVKVVLGDHRERGDFSLLSGTLDLMKDAITGDADYFVCLSGEDYPCRPLIEMRDDLSMAGDGWLHTFPALDREMSDWPYSLARQRYHFRWFVGPRISASWSRRLRFVHALNRVQPWFRFNVVYGRLRVAARRRPLLEDSDWYGGSAWWTLSRRAVEYVLDAARSRHDLMDWARHTIAVDESFFQTVLSTAPGFAFDGDGRRYFDFGETGLGHPKSLTVDDLPAIHASNAYFCRKVNDHELVARLDEVIRS